MSAGTARGVVALACLLAFLLRVLHASDQGIWGDEIFSIWYSGMSLPDIIRLNLANLDAHAPLFYYVLKFWTMVAGQNELVFRFPSAFFGVLAIPLIYLLGKHLADQNTGIIASVMMATNPFQVWYGQEARTYALTTLLTLLSVLLFCRLLQQKGPLWLWAGYCLVTLLSISSHYYAFFILAVEDLWLLLLLSRGKLEWRPWAIAHAVLLAPLLAGLWQVGYMMLRYRAEHLPLNPLGTVRDYLVQYTVGWFVDPVFGEWALAAFVAFAAVGLLWLFRARKTWLGLFLSFYLLVPISGALAYFWTTSGFPPRERYLVIVTPALYLLVAAGVAASRRLSPLVMGLAILVALSPQAYALGNYYGQSRYARPDYRAVARHIQSWEDKGDAIVAIGHLTADVFRYYYKGSAPITQFRYYPGENSREEIQRKLHRLAQENKRIWLLPSGDGRDDPDAEEWLNDNAYEVENHWLARARLALYATGPLPSEQPLNSAARLETKLELASYRMSSGQAMSGDILRLALNWRPLEDLGQRYKVSVRLRDDRGHILRQADRSLGGALRSNFPKGSEVMDRVGLRVPNGMMPGALSVEVAIYRDSDGRSLSFLDANGAPSGTWLSLGRLQVVKGPAPASLDRFEIPQAASYDVNGDWRLVGFGLGRDTLMPGERLTVSLFWQALTKAPDNIKATIKLIDQQGAVAGESPVPTERQAVLGWTEGDVFRELIDLSIPANATGGRYVVSLAPGLGSELSLGQVAVKARERRFDMSAVQQSSSAAFGALARLRGSDLSREGSEPKKGALETRPGDKLTLVLYWEALGASAESYTVFTHLLDGGGRMWGQHDGIPALGTAPTPGWVTGEIVADRHDIVVKEDAPAGEYVIEVGLYDPGTGRRLRTEGGEDRVIVGKAVVRK
ncbi:MAG: glycosyltransferase family 39 protein [Chloroflexi bacterium]|nr:glycosyltransferase family 39 protein [Chloroflexota bacterium]